MGRSPPDRALSESAASIDDAELPILEALSEQPSLSQRKLAERAGLSLTRTHFVLKRLVERGVLKVKTAAKSEHKLGYLYILTPRGIDEKARLTYMFMQRAAQQYQAMTGRLARTLQVAVAKANPAEGARANVHVRGTGPVAEVMRDVVVLSDRADLSHDIGTADVAILVTEPGLNPEPPPEVPWIVLGGHDE